MKREAVTVFHTSSPRDPVVFTDGSARNNAVGIGVKWGGSLRWPDISRTVATSEQLDPYAAELVALDSAVSDLLTALQRDSTRTYHNLFSLQKRPPSP